MSDWFEWSDSARLRRSAVASVKRVCPSSGPSGYSIEVHVTLLNGEVYKRDMGSIFYGPGIDTSEKEAALNARVKALLDEVTAE